MVAAEKDGSIQLREFELIVLLAILQLRKNAYGTTIKREIETRTGRAVARGAVYITLERLQSKKYLTSWMGSPSAVRGGRAKRFYQVEPQGINAVRQSLAHIKSMGKGLAPLVDEL